MRRSQSLYLALVISIVVCGGSDAQSREQPVYCYPPTVTAVAPGQVFNGKVCRGPLGCYLRPLVLSPVFDFANKPRVM
jgi:hypothetical protein